MINVRNFGYNKLLDKKISFKKNFLSIELMLLIIWYELCLYNKVLYDLYFKIL